MALSPCYVDAYIMICDVYLPICRQYGCAVREMMSDCAWLALWPGVAQTISVQDSHLIFGLADSASVVRQSERVNAVVVDGSIVFDGLVHSSESSLL